MKKRRMALVAAGLAMAFLVPATAANASSTGKVVGGGNWNYGVDGATVFSNYSHPTKYHSATACDHGVIQHCDKKYANKGAWAKAATPSSWLGGNTAYWDTY